MPAVNTLVHLLSGLGFIFFGGGLKRRETLRPLPNPIPGYVPGPRPVTFDLLSSFDPITECFSLIDTLPRNYVSVDVRSHRINQGCSGAGGRRPPTFSTGGTRPPLPATFLD